MLSCHWRVKVTQTVISPSTLQEVLKHEHQTLNFSGNVASCNTFNVELVNGVAAINTYSWVRFEWVTHPAVNEDPAWNECIRLDFATRSWMIPSKVDKTTNVESYPD